MSTPKVPGLEKDPSLLQTIQWIIKPLEVLQKQAQLYGDIFAFPVASSRSPQVVISNPEGIEKIFTADLKQLDSGEEAGIKLPLLGQNSLLALAGDRHKRQRKLLMPPFHGERMRVYGELIRDIIPQYKKFVFCRN